MPFLFMALGVLLLYGLIGLIVWGYCREDVVASINDEAVNQSKALGRWRGG
jgi:ABC-type bacteriocin/lantibiotic exporter with double-glycine peptidase domain